MTMLLNDRVGKWFCLHRAHASLEVEAGAGLVPDHSQPRPADILVQHWNHGRPVALDITVVSPLNPSNLAEARE